MPEKFHRPPGLKCVLSAAELSSCLDAKGCPCWGTAWTTPSTAKALLSMAGLMLLLTYWSFLAREPFPRMVTLEQW